MAASPAPLPATVLAGVLRHRPSSRRNSPVGLQVLQGRASSPRASTSAARAENAAGRSTSVPSRPGAKEKFVAPAERRLHRRRRHPEGLGPGPYRRLPVRHRLQRGGGVRIHPTGRPRKGSYPRTRATAHVRPRRPHRDRAPALARYLADHRDEIKGKRRSSSSSPTRRTCPAPWPWSIRGSWTTSTTSSGPTWAQSQGDGPDRLERPQLHGPDALRGDLHGTGHACRREAEPGEERAAGACAAVT